MAQEDPRELYIIIAENLKRLRNEYHDGQGISQLNLAKHLGISQQTYASYETASARISIEMLSVIASFYGVSMSSILRRAGAPVPGLMQLSEESFTEDEMAEIMNYVQFVKQKRKL